MDTYNELKILKIVDRPEGETRYASWGNGKWAVCLCSCGKEVTLPLFGVKSGIIKSCGHLRNENGSSNLKKYYENNRSPNAVLLKHGDEELSISEWSNKLKIPRSTLTTKLKNGDSIHNIIERTKNDDNKHGAAEATSTEEP